MSDPRPRGTRILLSLTRVWLPGTIALAGAVAVVLGHGRTGLAAAGVVLLGTAVMVWMINWMFRLSLQSNRDRELDERAREFYDRNGFWPDEEQR